MSSARRLCYQRTVPKHAILRLTQLRSQHSFPQEQVPQFNASPRNEASPVHDENVLRKPLRHFWRSDDFYNQECIDVKSLGKPIEVLLLKEHEPRSPKLHLDSQPEVVEGHDFTGPSEMLDAIRAEVGLVSSARAGSNIESIKISWISKLSNRLMVPTISEYQEIKNELLDGFTYNQLQHYYKHQSKGVAAGPMEFSLDFSSNLYTRSAWQPGTTAFHGDRSSHPTRSKKKYQEETRADDGTPSNPLMHQEPLKYDHTLKDLVAEKILRQHWNFIPAEERATIGGLDILIKKKHLDLLLNHRRGILTKIAERYGVKVEALVSKDTIRIHANYETCGDIFKFIVYTLENIRYVYLDHLKKPRVEDRSLPGDNMVLMNRSMFDQVEQLTSTLIRPARGKNKLCIHYLGPEEDDLHDVRRVFSLVSQSTNQKTSCVLWDERLDPSQISSCPVEAGRGLPLIQRVSNWSRWTKGIIRKTGVGHDIGAFFQASEHHIDEASRNRNSHREWLYDKAYDSLFQKLSWVEPTNIPSFANSWEKLPIYQTAAVFGQVLYPGSILGDMTRESNPGENQKSNTVLNECLNSPRQLLTSFSGCNQILRNHQSDMETHEYILVKLAPPLKAGSRGGNNSVFPELELHVDIDTKAKKVYLSQALLVIEDTAVDILRPENALDIRLTSKTYVPSGPEIDEQIIKFISASNLNVFNSQRLTTPKNMTISLPDWASGRIVENDGSNNHRSFQPGPSAEVEYHFSGLEHRSVCTRLEKGLKLEHNLIEGGLTGGRREEIRMIFRNHSSNQHGTPSPPDQSSFRGDLKQAEAFVQHFDKPHDMIPPPRVRSIVTSKGNDVRLYEERLGLSK